MYELVVLACPSFIPAIPNDSLCQCGCNYEGKPGGSSTSANDSANNAHGYTSDGSHPCCSTTDPKPEFPEITPPPFWNPQDALCGHF